MLRKLSSEIILLSYVDTQADIYNTLQNVSSPVPSASRFFLL